MRPEEPKEVTPKIARWRKIAETMINAKTVSSYADLNGMPQVFGYDFPLSEETVREFGALIGLAESKAAREEDRLIVGYAQNLLRKYKDGLAEGTSTATLGNMMDALLEIVEKSNVRKIADKVEPVQREPQQKSLSEEEVQRRIQESVKNLFG
jgi:hypothetical protein